MHQAKMYECGKARGVGRWREKGAKTTNPNMFILKFGI